MQGKPLPHGIESRTTQRVSNEKSQTNPMFAFITSIIHHREWPQFDMWMRWRRRQVYVIALQTNTRPIFILYSCSCLMRTKCASPPTTMQWEPLHVTHTPHNTLRLSRKSHQNGFESVECQPSRLKHEVQQTDTLNALDVCSAHKRWQVKFKYVIANHSNCSSNTIRANEIIVNPDWLKCIFSLASHTVSSCVWPTRTRLLFILHTCAYMIRFSRVYSPLYECEMYFYRIEVILTCLQRNAFRRSETQTAFAMFIECQCRCSYFSHAFASSDWARISVILLC